MNRHPRLMSILVGIVVSAVLLGACGDATDDAGETTPTTSPTVEATSTSEVPTPTSSPAPTPTEPPGSGSPLVADDELATAADQVEDFLDALGSGDIDQAASLLGPVSDQRAADAGGVESLLRTSSEGHGAWASVPDRSVSPVAMDRDLIAVLLEGDLQVEGTIEHRVEVVPVRKAESGDAWFVELWAYDLAAGNPIDIADPTVDDQERATVDSDEGFDVTVVVPAEGALTVSFDGAARESVEATADDPVTLSAPAGTSTVIVLYRSGSDVAGRGFVVERR